jgi:prepilin-type N-terminal cleavage/methylation domain-containing protein
LRESRAHSAGRSRLGFTLIEVMAAVFLSSIVITVAVSFQINLGSATAAARERLRTQRQAVGLLDRISRDLASTYFIAASDRLKAGIHPWIFLTGRDFTTEEKSDKVKFITRNYQPQSLDRHASDLAVVAYYLVEQENRPGYQLMRWRETHMPQEYDPSFPADNDPDATVVGENIASFNLTLIDNSGSELPEWSSARRRGRNSLPIAVRIEISMLDPNQIDPDYDPDDPDNFDGPDNTNDFENEANDDLEIDDELDPNRKIYSKLVIIPLRPLDWSFLEAEVRASTPDGDGEDVDEEDDDDGEEGEDDENGFDNGNSNDPEDPDDPFRGIRGGREENQGGR